MSLPQPFQSTVREEWIDYNGHLNEAYYVLIFSHATDAMIDWMGMEEAYRQSSGLTVYTLETHVCYLDEVHAGASVHVDTRLLDLDAKRIRLFHTMTRADDGKSLCTAEMLMACVDSSGPKTTPFPEVTAKRLGDLYAAQSKQPWPERAGRAIAVKKPTKALS